jgi:hypothetical protein
MDSYLQEQRHEGELDSEGCFTVDTLAALRKTLASALPEPHYYLFQIGQGLIAGGCRNIEIAVGRSATRFHFSDPAGTFKDLEAARARLGQPLTLSSTHPLDLVLTGMATAVGAEMDRVDLHTAYSAKVLQMTLETAALVEKPDGHRDPVCRLELHRTVSKGLSFAWTRIWGARSEESELQSRFEFATPALKIAGLRTTPGSGWRQEVSPVLNVGRLVLLEAAVIDPGYSAHRGPCLPTIGSEVDAPVRRLCRWACNARGEALDLAEDAAEWEQRAWSFYGTGSAQVESVVWWIRNGMTVEKTYFDLGLPGFLVLAPADGLDVDAGGYALVRNDKFHDRVVEAGRLARMVVGATSRDALSAMLSDLSGALAVSGDSPGADELLAEFPWLSARA